MRARQSGLAVEGLLTFQFLKATNDSTDLQPLLNTTEFVGNFGLKNRSVLRVDWQESASAVRSPVLSFCLYPDPLEGLMSIPCASKPSTSSGLHSGDVRPLTPCRQDPAMVAPAPRSWWSTELYRSSDAFRSEQSHSRRTWNSGRADGVAFIRFSVGVRNRPTSGGRSD